MKNIIFLLVLFFVCTISALTVAQQVAIYPDNEGSTPTDIMTFVTSNLNSYFPNTTNHYIAGVGGRVYIEVDNTGAPPAWDISMFSWNPSGLSGLIHEIHTNEQIVIKYRSSTWEESYATSSLTDGLVGTASGQLAYDVFSNVRWIVNSTTGNAANLAPDDKPYSVIASSDRFPIYEWNYANKRVEIIFILGLTPGLDQGGNPINTADKSGAYKTTIGFEVVNF
ncbi:MAG: hypothetical protein AB1454_09270 [Candidatus Auribacterota bacterium]